MRLELHYYGIDYMNTVKIITISGDLGAGKSSLATALIKNFEAAYYSTGAVQRQIAEEMGMTTLELNKIAETEAWVDEKIDGVFKSLSESPTNLVIDSRMAWHFLPDSFKIRLEVDIDTAAQRVNGDKNRHNETYESLENTKSGLVARRDSEYERFQTYYGVNIRDHKNYDLVIDTSQATPISIAQLAAEQARNFFNGKTTIRNWSGNAKGYLVSQDGGA